MQARWKERDDILTAARDIITQLKAKMSGQAVDAQDITLQMLGAGTGVVNNILAARAEAPTSKLIAAEDSSSGDEMTEI